MKWTIKDFIDDLDKLHIMDDLDKLQHKNNNELAYYRGKTDGYNIIGAMALTAEEVGPLVDRLYSYRQQLIQDKEELRNKDNDWVEGKRRSICGQLDAIDEVRELLLDKKGAA